MTIDAQELTEIFNDCFFTDEEIEKLGRDAVTEKAIIVPALMYTFAFHPDRIEQHREEVEAMLDQLPETFHENSGGGWSFLNMCMTKDGEQWGEQANAEQLLALGVALDRVTMTPRELWAIFPGGVPYLTIKERTT